MKSALDKWLDEMLNQPTQEERETYEHWLTATESMLGRDVVRGGELEMIFLKDYLAGKNPVQASDDYKVFEEESKRPRALKIINRHGVETDVMWPFD